METMKMRRTSILIVVLALLMSLITAGCEDYYGLDELGLEEGLKAEYERKMQELETAFEIIDKRMDYVLSVLNVEEGKLFQQELEERIEEASNKVEAIFMKITDGWEDIWNLYFESPEMQEKMESMDEEEYLEFIVLEMEKMYTEIMTEAFLEMIDELDRFFVVFSGVLDELELKYTGDLKSYDMLKKVKIYLQLDNVYATVNEESVMLDQHPVTRNDRTLVPLRFLGESLGAEVVWEEQTKTVTYITEEVEIMLQIGSDIGLVNGIAVKLDAAPQIINGRTMVPLRFISETLGYEVIWEKETRGIYIEN